jgi:hypothetical protein
VGDRCGRFDIGGAQPVRVPRAGVGQRRPVPGQLRVGVVAAADAILSTTGSVSTMTTPVRGT